MLQKIMDENYIIGLADGAKGTHGTEITEQQYNELTEIFHAMPTAREGYEYKLTVDRKWIEVPLDTDPDVDDADALSILVGEGGDGA